MKCNCFKRIEGLLADRIKDETGIPVTVKSEAKTLCINDGQLVARILMTAKTTADVKIPVKYRKPHMLGVYCPFCGLHVETGLPAPKPNDEGGAV